MIVSTSDVDPISNISIAGTAIGRVCHYEYLGMTIEHKLSMDKQIEQKTWNSIKD